MRNSIKRKLTVLLALLLILMVSILLFYKRNNAISRIVKADFPGQPTILFIFDSRNTQSVKFINDFFDYLNRNWLLINVGTVFLNAKIVPFNGRYQVIEKDNIRKLGVSRDAFLFFSPEGKLLSQGTLSNIPDSLLIQVNPQYPSDNQHIFDALLEIADTTEKIYFLSNMKGRLGADLTCFVFFDQICLCNNSVNTINKIMEIEEYSSVVHHFIIPMFSYSQEDIELTKNNNHFLVDFLLPSFEDLRKWSAINKDPLHKHPLNELVILADSHGKILLFSNKWEKYLSWRNEHYAKDIKEVKNAKENLRRARADFVFLFILGRHCELPKCRSSNV